MNGNKSQSSRECNDGGKKKKIPQHDDDDDVGSKIIFYFDIQQCNLVECREL
jgi:hypothetical protein